MNAKKAILPVVLVVFVGVLAVQAWRWRQPVTRPPDPEQQVVAMMADKAVEEIQAFEKAGGKPGATDHPGRKWAEELWKYREAHPRTLAAKMATTIALELLAETSSWDELLARAKSSPPDGPDTAIFLYALYARARAEKQFPAFIAYVQESREKANGNRPQDETMRAQLDYHLGRAYDALRNAPQARAAFERAIQEAPASLWARDSRTGIYELEHLSRGLPAPQFVGTGLDGKPIALADLRGKTIVLDFWGKG